VAVRASYWYSCRSLEPNHPNVVQLMGTVEFDDEYWIVLDKCDNGSLDEYLQERPALSARVLVQLCLDCSKGVEHVHKSHVMHSDLKPNNFLVFTTGAFCMIDEYSTLIPLCDCGIMFHPMQVNANGQAVLADLGCSKSMARVKRHHDTEPAGTNYYWSPEQIINGKNFDEDEVADPPPETLRTDIFSLSLVFREIVTDEEFCKDPTPRFLRSVVCVCIVGFFRENVACCSRSALVCHLEI
jgi:serine/threonine protein kinase